MAYAVQAYKPVKNQAGSYTPNSVTSQTAQIKPSALETAVNSFGNALSSMGSVMVNSAKSAYSTLKDTFTPKNASYAVAAGLAVIIAFTPVRTQAQERTQVAVVNYDTVVNYDSIAREGAMLNAQGKYQETISLLRPYAADRGNNSALLHNELGGAFASTGNLEEALVQHREAVGLNPRNPVYYFNLAHVQIRLRQFIEARRTIESMFSKERTRDIDQIPRSMREKLVIYFFRLGGDRDSLS